MSAALAPNHASVNTCMVGDEDSAADVLLPRWAARIRGADVHVEGLRLGITGAGPSVLGLNQGLRGRTWRYR